MTETPGEAGVTYRRHPFWKDYMIGDDGSVWSSKRNRWRKMRPAAPRTGRGRLALYVSHIKEDGGTTAARKYVHHLVLETFVGPRPEGMECCHGPGGPYDNSLTNLRWDTRIENRADIKRHKILALATARQCRAGAGEQGYRAAPSPTVERGR